MNATTLATGMILLAAWLATQARSAGAAGCVRLSEPDVETLAGEITRRFFPAVDPVMLRAMAEIESARDPCAIRHEPHIGDASVGLMQTLVGTSRWLYREMGATAFGEPDALKLADPAVSMYFAAAYVDFLRRYRGRARSEEFIVRGYNGGPDGINRDATLGHWERYQAAKAELS